MPVFVYRCQRCKEEFEEEMDRKEKKTPPCPYCDCKETRKVIQPTPVHYRGDGFTKKVTK